MPPRHAYWTILAGGLPTAFRAAEKDELLPTFHRIKAKQPDAEMKWFARGKLWASPDEAQRHGRDMTRASSGARAHEARGKDWRPGGQHRDPREQFKDAKKQRNQDWRKRRWELKHRDEASGTGSRRPSGLRDNRASDPQGQKSSGLRDEKPSTPRDRDDRLSRSRFRDRSAPRERPHGDPLGDRQTKGSRQGSDWRRSDAGTGARSRDERPWSGKPRSSSSPRQDRPDDSSSEKAQRHNRNDRPRFDKPRDESRRPPPGKFTPAADRKPQPRDLDGRASSRPRPSPRPAPHGDKLRDEIPRRPFKPAQGHGRTQSGGGAPKERGQWEERTPPQPPRPPRPEREPRPEAEPGPEPPPHPSEPVVPPTEPPERGGEK